MYEARRSGLLIILSSPSGAGKTTLSRKLVEWDNSIVISISATTRKARDNERDGEEYFFKSRSEFERMVENGELLEHAEVFGNMYGTPARFVEQCIEDSQDVIFDIDWQGGKQIKNSPYVDNMVSLFVLPPSIKELDRRLRQRGEDSRAMVGGRMNKCQDEISHWLDYDYVLVNNELDTVLDQIKSIVISERLKRTRQLGLSSFVQLLNKEFEDRTK